MEGEPFSRARRWARAWDLGPVLAEAHRINGYALGATPVMVPQLLQTCRCWSWEDAERMGSSLSCPS